MTPSLISNEAVYFYLVPLWTALISLIDAETVKWSVDEPCLIRHPPIKLSYESPPNKTGIVCLINITALLLLRHCLIDLDMMSVIKSR